MSIKKPTEQDYYYSSSQPLQTSSYLTQCSDQLPSQYKTLTIQQELQRSLLDSAIKFGERGRMTFAQVGGLLNHLKIFQYLKYDEDSILSNEEEILRSSRAMNMIGAEMYFHETLWEMLFPFREENSASETIKCEDLVLLFLSLITWSISKKNTSNEQTPFLILKGGNLNYKDLTFDNIMTAWNTIINKKSISNILHILISCVEERFPSITNQLLENNENSSEQAKEEQEEKDKVVLFENKSTALPINEYTFIEQNKQIEKSNQTEQTYLQRHQKIREYERSQEQNKSHQICRKKLQQGSSHKRLNPSEFQLTSSYQYGSPTRNTQRKYHNSHSKKKQSSSFKNSNHSFLLSASPIKKEQSNSQLFSSTKKDQGENPRNIDYSQLKQISLLNSCGINISSSKKLSNFNKLYDNKSSTIRSFSQQSSIKINSNPSNRLSEEEQQWKKEIILKHLVANQNLSKEIFLQVDTSSSKKINNLSNKQKKNQPPQASRLFDFTTPEKKEIIRNYKKIENECEELGECTFQPILFENPTYSHIESRIPKSPSQIIIHQRSRSYSPSQTIKGFANSVKRLKKGFIQSKELKEKVSLRSPSPSQIQNNNDFNSFGSYQQDMNSSPFFQATITLASGKQEKIDLCEGDDPVKVAADFARCYFLNQYSHSQLKYTLVEKYKQHAIYLIRQNNPME